MAVPLKEFLRRLRAEGGGWSYAVFWKAVQRGSSFNLVWGEGDYGRPSIAGPDIPPSGCEAALKEGELGGQEVRTITILVENTMKPKVHLVGYGIVGTAVLTGNHRWIVHGAVSSHAYSTQDLADFNNQWLSGIQTIAVIPVLPHGVIQLGSTQRMMENLELINQTRTTFAQISCVLKPSFSESPLSSSLEKCNDSVPPPSNPNVNYQGRQILDSRHLMQPPIRSVSEVNRGRPSILELPVYSNPAFTGLFNSLDGLLQRKAPNMKSVSSQFGEHNDGSDCHHTLSDLNLMLNKPLVDTDLKSDNQCEASNSAPIPLDSPLSLQKLFSSLRAQNVRHSEQSMCAGTFVRPGFPGPPAASYSTTSTLILPSGRGEPIKNENLNEKFGPLLCRIPSNATIGFENKLSQVEASRIVDDATTCSNGHPQQSATDTCFLTETDCYAASAPVSRKHKTRGTFLQVPQTSHKDITDPHSSTCSDVTSHEIGRMPGINLQARRVPHNGTCEQRSSLLLDDWNACSHDGKTLASLDVVEDVFQASNMCSSGSDLFDVLGLNQNSGRCNGDLSLVKLSVTEDDCKSGINNSTYRSQVDKDHMVIFPDCAPTYEALPDNGNNGNDELLDAVVSRVNCTVRQDTEEASCRTSLTRTTGSSYGDDHLKCSQPDSTRNFPKELFNPSLRILQTGIGGPATFKSSSRLNELGECSRIEGICNSQTNFWVDNENIRNETVPAHCKTGEDSSKGNRKRPKPGENPRPRPKDRQMIQDRLKELREIVPNGAKLSIDALLENTIKHMLFLQSVTKHADKLKETREPKIISEEGGLLLKDNFEGGVTWAFEVGSQSMVCPIIVEDLNPPRQLLVEMLCEQRGLFLEIADLIKGLGLTILKGVMEARNDKVWARFAVEANRDVTRMDIFLSLVKLLEPRAVSSVPQQHFDGITMANNVLGQPIAASCAVNPMM